VNQTHLHVRWSCCFHKLRLQIVPATQAGRELSAGPVAAAPPTALSPWHGCGVPMPARKRGIAPSCGSYASSTV